MKPSHRQKTPKTVAGPQQKAWWPCAREPVNDYWALEAIDHGNGSILARYLREAEEIDPRVRRELAEILSPTSKHVWRLRVRYRFRGTPTKRATKLKPVIVAALAPLAKHIAGPKPIDATYRRTLANMLDTESCHPLQLAFRHRKAGKPPRKNPWLPSMPIDLDLAMRLLAKESGNKKKLFERALPDQKKLSRATYYRLKARSKNI
jgi:hypothetical protein